MVEVTVPDFSGVTDEQLASYDVNANSPDIISRAAQKQALVMEIKKRNKGKDQEFFAKRAEERKKAPPMPMGMKPAVISGTGEVK